MAAAPGRFAWLRERFTDRSSLLTWSIIANDGIIATAGLLEGFAGAGADDRVLLLAATAATIAGMLAVGGVEWMEASVEREAQLSLVAEEQREIDADPERELADLAAHYEGRGVSPELAIQVAEQLMAHDPLAAQLDSEHGIREITTVGDTVLTGIGGALAFGLGALIPLLITWMFPVGIEAVAIVVAVVISLSLTSVVTARLGETPLWRTLLRSLVVGVGTLLVSYVVGSLVF
ncbi:MAG: VIT1/CCC1 transporter family protein [Actinobacteria bacterium]|nr:VIT1/CCC1 transporter family protein [Actinomycetota bacterium]